MNEDIFTKIQTLIASFDKSFAAQRKTTLSVLLASVSVPDDLPDWHREDYDRALANNEPTGEYIAKCLILRNKGLITHHHLVSLTAKLCVIEGKLTLTEAGSTIDLPSKSVANDPKY